MRKPWMLHDAEKVLEPAFAKQRQPCPTHSPALHFGVDQHPQGLLRFAMHAYARIGMAQP